MLSLRTAKGESLATVGKALGISANYLGEIERGVKIPSDPLIRQIAQYYDIDENLLYESFGKIPLAAIEELENNETLRKVLSEIRGTDLPEEKKQEIYEEVYRLYKKAVSET